jgi:argininosuccinate synthase
MRNIESFLENSQSKVNGEVYINLFPFRFELDGIKSANDLMNDDFGSYGEINKSWSADEAKGFIKISSISNKIYYQTNIKDKK